MRIGLGWNEFGKLGGGMNAEFIVYQTHDGQTKFDIKLSEDTVWLSQAQMVELFQRNQGVISRHINNVFNDGELNKESNMQKTHIPNSERRIT
jgi:hypothetical protein